MPKRQTILANFNDVTNGNNLFYSAGKGYDNASGWGSFHGANLFASLTNGAPAPTPPTPPTPTPPTPTPPTPTPPAPVPPALTPELTVSMNHLSPFARGKTGTYSIVVENKGKGATTGPVSVVVKLPNSLTYNAASGNGWAFDASTLTFTQTTTLEPGASYPPLELTVNVSRRAPYTVTPTATVSGGGSASNTTSNKTTTHFRIRTR